MNSILKKVAVIVAHPDDEILWAGGTILTHPEWECFIISLCRKNDSDRAPKFYQVLNTIGATGLMGDLDDQPEQAPLSEEEVQNAILALLPGTVFDLVITHSIYGEYTRHRRHEEIGKAVIQLWRKDRLQTKELWAFAYEDGNRTYNPVIIRDAPLTFLLPRLIWERKYQIITEIYGFKAESWEAQTTPKEEAFWRFSAAQDAFIWLQQSYITT